MDTKGDKIRSDLKNAITELDTREKKDRPKKLKGGNRDILKKVGVGVNYGRTLKNLRKEFNERFDKQKAPEKPKTSAPKEPQPMQPLSKGGRAGYKTGSKGCKLAMKGKGRAYGKNS